jgi:hypothetical protein
LPGFSLSALKDERDSIRVLLASVAKHRAELENKAFGSGLAQIYFELWACGRVVFMKAIGDPRWFFRQT